MKKLFLQSILTTALLTVTPFAAHAHFSDISDSPHKDAINIIGEAGYIEASNGNLFEPNRPITREEAAFLLANALQLNTKNVANPKFKDVSTSHPYYGHIAALKEANIISGYNGYFTPDSTLTRGQMAKMLAESYKLQATSNKTKFNDANNSIFKHYIAALYEHNITLGKSATAFGVNDLLTRAEMATFVVRAMNSQPNASEVDILLTASMQSMVPWMPKLATLIQEERAKNPQLLVFDAGNMLGTYSPKDDLSIYREVFKGQVELDLMNALQYDVQGLGLKDLNVKEYETEHYEQVNQLLKQATYPILFSNSNLERDELVGLEHPYITMTPQDGKIYKGYIMETNGEKIGVLSLMNGMSYKTHPIAPAQEIVATFKNLGINKIVALSSFSNVDEEDIISNQSIARAVPEIDVILTTTRLFENDNMYTVSADENGKPMTPTYIIGATEYLYDATKINLQFDAAGVLHDVGLETKVIDDYEKEPKTEAIVEQYTNALANYDYVNKDWLTPTFIQSTNRVTFRQLLNRIASIEGNTLTMNGHKLSLVNEGYTEAYPGLIQGLLDNFTRMNREEGFNAEFITSPELNRLAASRAQFMANIHDQGGSELLKKATHSHLGLWGLPPEDMGIYFSPGLSIKGEIIISTGDPYPSLIAKGHEFSEDAFYNKGRSFAGIFDTSQGHRIFYRWQDADDSLRLGVAYATSKNGALILVVVKGTSEYNRK